MIRRAVLILSLLLLTMPVLAQTAPDAIPTIEFANIVPAPNSFPLDYFDALDQVQQEIEESNTRFPPQYAGEDLIAFVSVNIANLRNAPDIDDSVVVDTVIWGERFPIIGVYYPGESTVREPVEDNLAVNDPELAERQDFVYDDPGERERWYLISVGGGGAWIFGGVVIVANPELLDRYENRMLTPEEQAFIDAQLAFASSTVSMRYTSRLRSGPGTNYSQVGIVPFQARVGIIGRNEYSTWFYINYNGSAGWVHFELMAIPEGFNASAVPVIR